MWLVIGFIVLIIIAYMLRFGNLKNKSRGVIDSTGGRKEKIIISDISDGKL